ncbi:MAG: hypothetical protein AAGB31_08985, partial [Bdellovibrio sp.]
MDALGLNLAFEPQLDIDLLRQDPETDGLLKALSAFAQTLALYGYKVSIASKEALQKLPHISTARKREIKHYYELWNQWI